MMSGMLSGQTPEVAQREARSAPGLKPGDVVYQVWLRSFTPEATLAAATARLKDVAALGATIVYLSPVQKMSRFGGFSNPYRIEDFDQVDPDYGTEADLKAFAGEAHRLGMRVLMDMVYYHTAPDSVLMKRPGFYRMTADGKVEAGTWGLPRPDFAKPEVREYFTRNLLHWVRDIGVDGFRCDVAAGVPLPFWENARVELEKVNPKVILLAESDLPAEQLQAFDCSYNFPWYETLVSVLVKGEPATRLKESWMDMRGKFPRGARFLRLSDNHDRDRADIVFGERGAMATAVLNFTLDGLPFIYNGQEIGDRNRTSHNRRTPIDWQGGAREPQKDLFAKLCAIRKNEAALHAGDVVWVANSNPNEVVSFLRRSGTEEILSVVNVSNRRVEVTVDLPVADYMPMTDLITGKGLGSPMAPGRLVFKLEGFGYAVGKRGRIRALEMPK
jgi:glycosidase